MRLLRTNTGFLITSPTTADGNDQYLSVPIFSKLYLQLVNDERVTKTWEWRRAAMQAVAKTFAANPTFFKDQIFSNAPMNARTVDFLYSTFSFIMVGKRQLAVQLWNDLLEFHPADLTPVAHKTKERFSLEYRNLFILNSEQILAMWLSQPGGLEDMICTMYIMFADLPINWQSI